MGVGPTPMAIGVSQGAQPATSNQQWMNRLKVEPGLGAMTTASGQTVVVSSAGGMVFSTGGPIIATSVTSGQGVTSLNLGTLDCYEDMFKEITKKLYGEEGGLAEVVDSSGMPTQNIVFDDGTLSQAAAAGFQFITSTNANGLPAGTILLQRRIADDKGIGQSEQVALSTTVALALPPQQVEERWFESDDTLGWTSSKIARYNPAQKVFRCVDCDFVGFLSRVAEHWLGNHASLRVFQCPRCPYTSAWARCVRMHLTRQHGESLTDNSLWKENPVLEEVTKFLTGLKTRVEQKGESAIPGEKRYTCQFCSYATDRRDLFNRHENIHRDEKPFQCYVCDKQFNRADHVKKHFTRMHRDHVYDINRIKKNLPKSHAYYSTSNKSKQSAAAKALAQQQLRAANDSQVSLQNDSGIISDASQISVQIQSQGGTSQAQQQIPHIAYFNPPSTPGQTGPLQGIQGVGGNKKEAKAKGAKKKKQGDKMYTCSYCPWQGVDNWCLKRHLNTHIKPFLCSLCDYKAARSERLATHVLKVHNKRVCHKCSFLADDPDSLNQHIQDSHQNPLVKTGFNCNVCQEYFEQRADLEAHAILEHQKVIVQCDLCDFRTTDELSMEAHLRDKHNLQPGMGAVAAAAAAAAAAVGIGGQPVNNSTVENTTCEACTGHSGPHICNKMQLTVQTGLDVPDQMDVEISDANHLLQMPGSEGDVLDDMTYEQDTSSSQKNGGDSMTMSEIADTDIVEEEEYEEETLCEACGCEFTDERSLRNHQKRHRIPYRERRPPELRNSKAISRTYTCSTCSYNSPTSKTMMQHQRTHSGFEQTCLASFCKYKSAYDNSLKEHILAEHKDGSTRCPHCGCKILSLNDFTVHWRNHHSNLCGLCVSVYKTKFEIKEEEIHEIVLKTPALILQEEFENGKLFGIADMDPQDPQDIEGGAIKKPRMELASTVRSVSTYFNSESIKFLPRFDEVFVLRLRIPNSPRTNKSGLRWKATQNSSRAKHGSSFVMGLLGRKGSSTSYKCHRPECGSKNRRYSNKYHLYLHNLWHHRKRTQCDSCGRKFFYLAQALLHKTRAHPEAFQTHKQNRLTMHASSEQTLPSTTQIIFKHERE